MRTAAAGASDPYVPALVAEAAHPKTRTAHAGGPQLGMSARRDQPSQPRPARPAFTLLEIVIASGLVTTLMLLVWSLFSVYTKLNAKGDKEATELQLVRSLVRQLRADLHHLAAAATTDSNPTRDALLFLPAAEVSAPLPTGPMLVGNATSLRFVVRSMRRDRAQLGPEFIAQEANWPPDVYDIVTYQWQPREHVDPLVVEEHVADTPPATPLDDDRHDAFGDEASLANSSGLTRHVVPWFLPGGSRSSGTAGAESPLDESRPLPVPAVRGEETDLVPEVARLRFRYFDGTTWQDQWDSQSTGQVPVAIEVAFDIQEEDEPAGADVAPGALQPPLREVHVVTSARTSDSSSITTADVAGSDNNAPGASDAESAAEYRSVIAIAAARSVDDKQGAAP